MGKEDTVGGTVHLCTPDRLPQTLRRPAWKRQVVWGVNCTTLNQFLGQGTSMNLGNLISTHGELFHTDNVNVAHTYLFSMVISSGAIVIENFRVLANDDTAYLYVDGTLQTSWTSGESVRYYTINLTAGVHVIQVMLNNTGGNQTMFLLGAGWGYNNPDHDVTWIRADSAA